MEAADGEGAEQSAHGDTGARRRTRTGGYAARAPAYGRRWGAQGARSRAIVRWVSRLAISHPALLRRAARGASSAVAAISVHLRVSVPSCVPSSVPSAPSHLPWSGWANPFLQEEWSVGTRRQANSSPYSQSSCSSGEGRPGERDEGTRVPALLSPRLDRRLRTVHRRLQRHVAGRPQDLGIPRQAQSSAASISWMPSDATIAIRRRRWARMGRSSIRRRLLAGHIATDQLPPPPPVQQGPWIVTGTWDSDGVVRTVGHQLRGQSDAGSGHWPRRSGRSRCSSAR